MIPLLYDFPFSNFIAELNATEAILFGIHFCLQYAKLSVSFECNRRLPSRVQISSGSMQFFSSIRTLETQALGPRSAADPEKPRSSFNLHKNLHSILIHLLFGFLKGPQTPVYPKAKVLCVQGPRFREPKDPASVCPRTLA
ncbi:hypothetical protein EVAR_97604_1 [Eumeta japonica]|uniref:Uncharacterized protein n=1 Tax=Eumeta variegata TaxID=151549 RepID=A0A4C1XMS1_EUMVA|nr:hypothetical protein EVAR_97604_1 [Eumeta japonica]